MTNLNVKKSKENSLKTLPFHLNIACASTASCIAETCTIPFDTVKVKMMVQGEAQTKRYSSFANCIYKVAKDEGLRSFFKGLSAGLQRQIIFAGIRIGYYPIVRDKLTSEKNPLNIPLHTRMLAALITGTIGIIIASPTDVVKIRLQADGRKSVDERRYSGSIDAYKKIIKTSGFKGLYSGLLPNIYRNGSMNCFELSSYDSLKSYGIKKFNINPDSKIYHMSCGSIAGIIAISLASPIDVAKTRIMNDSSNKYNGFLSCLKKSYQQEGFKVFYSGYIPNVFRVGSWNAVCFLALEFCQKTVRNNL